MMGHSWFIFFKLALVSLGQILGTGFKITIGKIMLKTGLMLQIFPNNTLQHQHMGKLFIVKGV